MLFPQWQAQQRHGTVLRLDTQCCTRTAHDLRKLMQVQRLSKEALRGVPHYSTAGDGDTDIDSPNRFVLLRFLFNLVVCFLWFDIACQGHLLTGHQWRPLIPVVIAPIVVSP